MHANYIRKAYLSLELGDGELMTGKRKLVNYCCSLIYSIPQRRVMKSLPVCSNRAFSFFRSSARLE